MFTQKISMDCTREQYEKYLKDELLKMGYQEMTMYWGRSITVFTNAANGVTGWMLDIEWGNKKGYDRTYLGSFNAPLFLALAAMTDNADGNYGEYWVCIKDNAWFTKDKLYKSIGVYHDKSPMFYDNKGEENGAFINHLFKYFRKATKEEIMAKFSKTETDTNYDAAKEFVEYFCDRANNLKVAAICDKINQFTKKAIEQENAIKLLKENGYKILKPKTWEEV